MHDFPFNYIPRKDVFAIDFFYGILFVFNNKFSELTAVSRCSAQPYEGEWKKKIIAVTFSIWSPNVFMLFLSEGLSLFSGSTGI